MKTKLRDFAIMYVCNFIAWALVTGIGSFLMFDKIGSLSRFFIIPLCITILGTVNNHFVMKLWPTSYTRLFWTTLLFNTLVAFVLFLVCLMFMDSHVNYLTYLVTYIGMGTTLSGLNVYEARKWKKEVSESEKAEQPELN